MPTPTSPNPKPKPPLVQYFKTSKYVFGVWPVKRREIDIVRSANGWDRFWQSEREAWEHLNARSLLEIAAAQKEMDRAHRNHAKALKRLNEIREK